MEYLLYNNICKTMEKPKKFVLKINNEDKVEELLQETYNQACAQLNQIQEEINKIANTTIIKELDIDGKEKYAKIMANYMTIQQKSIAQKFDISKLLSDIIKSNGNLNEALDGKNSRNMSFDISKLKEIAKNASNGGNNTTEQYTLKK